MTAIQNFGKKSLEQRPKGNHWAEMVRSKALTKLDPLHPLARDKESTRHGHWDHYFHEATDWIDQGSLQEAQELDWAYSLNVNSAESVGKSPFIQSTDKLPQGLQEKWLSLVGKSHSNAAQFNLATHKKPLFFHLPEGTKLDKPVVIFHKRNKPGFDAPLMFFHFGENTKAQILEVFTEDFTGIANQASYFAISAKADIESAQYHCGKGEHFFLDHRQYLVEDHAKLNVLSLGHSTNHLRTEINVHLIGHQAHADVTSLHGLITGQSDFYSNIEHYVPHTSARQTHRGLLAGESRSVFHGRVKIYPKAQKTDAGQMVKNVLFSKKAQAFTEPQLEIDADDVKCGHGAAVGELNPDELFYLQSRGIAPKKALSMMTVGNISDIVHKGTTSTALQDYLLQQLQGDFIDPLTEELL